MAASPAIASYKQLRFALARQAYQTDTVRLVDADISRADCLVTTRNGLFAVSQTGARLVAHGLFFGITIDRAHIYMFESCDHIRAGNFMGRVVRWRRGGDRLSDPQIICKGLENGCHQIAIIDDELVVVNTYQQLIHRFGMDGTPIATFDPLRSPNTEADAPAIYAHMNAIQRVGDTIYLMFHNGAHVPPMRSEVLVLCLCLLIFSNGAQILLSGEYWANSADKMGMIIMVGTLVMTVGVIFRSTKLIFAGLLVSGGQLTLCYGVAGVSKMFFRDWRSGQMLADVMSTSTWGHPFAA